MDPSEQCGYTLEAQRALFDGIKPLFSGKPLVVVTNKADIWREDLTEDKRELIGALKKELEEDGGKVLEMSNRDDDASVMAVKAEACDLLLQHRVEAKFRSKKADGILNRIHVAEPQKRDDRERPPCIPEAVLKRRMKKMALEGEEEEEEEQEEEEEEMDTGLERKKFFRGARRKTERDLELEGGDDYVLDLCKRYDLPNPDERYDSVPEIWNGKNVADFVDPDIMKKLDELEKEEEARERAGVYDNDDVSLNIFFHREMACFLI